VFYSSANLLIAHDIDIDWTEWILLPLSSSVIYSLKTYLQFSTTYPVSLYRTQDRHGTKKNSTADFVIDLIQIRMVMLDSIWGLIQMQMADSRDLRLTTDINVNFC